MEVAFAPVTPLTPLPVPRLYTATELHVQVYLGALRTLRFVEEQPPGSNAGQAVEAFLAKCGHKKGAPWCVAVLSYVADACFGRRWPFTMTAGTNDLSDQAKRKGLRFGTDVAEPGDIFLIWNPVKGIFRHAGVIAGPKGPKGWPTLEGNTNKAGSREGTAFLERTRTWAPGDRLVKWHRGMVG